jgi:acetyltransferase-like isoleucine patch superfamily enzyme
MNKNIFQERKTITQVILSILKKYFMYYIFFRGNKVRYLRWLGVKIGEGCVIQSKVEYFGSEPWLIEIGNSVAIANGVHLITHDGSSRLFRADLPGTSKFGNRFGRILIHDNSFIGVNAIIMPNVEIGPNSIVGVGSVVNKNILPKMVYAGVPAKPICTLDEYISRYKDKMIEINSDNREDLRRELTLHFWGEER